MLILLAVALADVPPSPGFVETCTLQNHQRPGLECEQCRPHFRDLERCKRTYQDRGYFEVCRTSGSSVRSEIWCRSKKEEGASCPLHESDAVDELQTAASTGQLSREQVSSLETCIRWGEGQERARASKLLVTDAGVSGDKARPHYQELAERHLRLDPSDASVAVILADQHTKRQDFEAVEAALAIAFKGMNMDRDTHGEAELLALLKRRATNAARWWESLHRERARESKREEIRTLARGLVGGVLTAAEESDPDRSTYQELLATLENPPPPPQPAQEIPTEEPGSSPSSGAATSGCGCSFASGVPTPWLFAWLPLLLWLRRRTR